MKIVFNFPLEKNLFLKKITRNNCYIYMKDLDYLISSLRAIWCPKAYSSRKPSSTQVSWHHILDHNWRVNLKSRWTHSWNKCKKLQRKLPAKICTYDVLHNGPGWVWKKSLTFIELNMLYVCKCNFFSNSPFFVP